MTDTTLLLCDTTIECSQQMTAMYQFKSYVKNSTDCFFEDRSKPHDHNLSVFDPLIIDRVAGEIMIMYRVVGFLFDACGVSSCGF